MSWCQWCSKRSFELAHLLVDVGSRIKEHPNALVRPKSETTAQTILPRWCDFVLIFQFSSSASIADAHREYEPNWNACPTRNKTSRNRRHKRDGRKTRAQLSWTDSGTRSPSSQLQWSQGIAICIHSGDQIKSYYKRQTRIKYKTSRHPVLYAWDQKSWESKYPKLLRWNWQSYLPPLRLFGLDHSEIFRLFWWFFNPLPLCSACQDHFFAEQSHPKKIDFCLLCDYHVW